jgi:hypothetical protein
VLQIEVRWHEQLVLTLARLCPGARFELVKNPALSEIIAGVLLSDYVSMKFNNVIQDEGNVFIFWHGSKA